VAPVASTRTAEGGRRTPRQARSRATVDFLLEAAAQVFGERGYAATTNQVAARAGVSIGTLYQYFADKDALLVALAERHLDQARAQLTTALAVAPSERNALVRALIETVVELNQPDDLHELLYATAPRTPALVRVLSQLRNDLADSAAALIIMGGATPQVAARRASALVIALDAAIHEHVLPATDPADRQARTDDLVLLALATLDAYTTATS
jgi:AcrR family transcriptional regulator